MCKGGFGGSVGAWSGVVLCIFLFIFGCGGWGGVVVVVECGAVAEFVVVVERGSRCGNGICSVHVGVSTGAVRADGDISDTFSCILWYGSSL